MKAVETEPCACAPRHEQGGILGMVCACDCHNAGPLTEALMVKAFTDLRNHGLPADDPRRVRHLRSAS